MLPEQAIAAEVVAAVVVGWSIEGLAAVAVAEEEDSEATSESAGPIKPPEAERRGWRGTALAERGEWVDPVVPPPAPS